MISFDRLSQEFDLMVLLADPVAEAKVTDIRFRGASSKEVVASQRRYNLRVLSTLGQTIYQTSDGDSEHTVILDDETQIGWERNRQVGAGSLVQNIWAAIDAERYARYSQLASNFVNNQWGHSGG